MECLKRIAAITMVRGDALFLELWLNYYSRELGAENLYVLVDGEDQQLPTWKGVHFEVFPHQTLNVAEGDKFRIGRINAKVRQLFEQYDIVIGGDVDEFLAVDPKAGLSLKEYLSRVPARSSLSGLGLDVGQNRHTETAYTPGVPVLNQRSYAVLSTRYTKPVVLFRPKRFPAAAPAWGSGFHRVKKHNFHIDSNLYLIHLGCFDYAYMKQKIAASGRLDEGWERHFGKRLRTITYVSERRARTDERILRTARLLQSIFRPPYAWNKPAMFGLHRVVRLPERFKNIL